MAKIQTKHYPKLIEPDRATSLYHHFQENIEWEDGVRSKNGFTRKAKPMQMGMDPVLDQVVMDALLGIGMQEAGVYGIYLNYYRNGEDYTPNHSHPGMKQVVISLGAPRTLTMGRQTTGLSTGSPALGKGSYIMDNGDVIVFGSSIHGVPKDPNCKEGRISIAMFLAK